MAFFFVKFKLILTATFNILLNYKKNKRKIEEQTGDILAIVDAAMDGPKRATCNDCLDEKLRRVDLPFLPLLQLGGANGRAWPAQTYAQLRVVLQMIVLDVFAVVFFADPLRPRLAEVSLELLVKALQINLICSHEPIIAFLHFHRPNTKNLNLILYFLMGLSQSLKDSDFISGIWGF